MLHLLHYTSIHIRLPLYLQANTPLLARFDIDDINLEYVIGRGQYTVLRGTMGGNTMAMKKIDCYKNEIPPEVLVHSMIPSHPNILPLFGVAHSKNGFTIYVGMELADKSLYRYLHEEKKKPSLQQSRKWALQIARGMLHIHQEGLAHCDLKSAHVLLFEEADLIKVCDFGSARVLERTATVTGMTGTYRWMAPEFHDRASVRISQQCDVFSFAMVLYELFAHEVPFHDIKDVFHVLPLIRNGERPAIPLELPSYIKTLIQSCWKHAPQDRPTFEKILQVRLTHCNSI